MNSDIRLAVTFPGHHKTVKLQRRLGPQGVLSLIWLWVHAAQNKPDGRLAGMDEEDVAIAAHWPGDPSEFVQILLDLRFLDDEAGTLVLHDWGRHNAYAAHSEARSEKARKAVAVRWEKARKAADGKSEKGPDSEVGGRDEYGEQYSEYNQALPLAPGSNAPSPSPSPSPSPKDYGQTAFDLFWSAYPNKVKKKPSLELWKRKKLDANVQMLVDDIRQRLIGDQRWKDGFIPDPTTYLRQERWNDEMLASRPQQGRHSASEPKHTPLSARILNPQAGKAETA